jgi:hypothetical protein
MREAPICLVAIAGLLGCAADSAVTEDEVTSETHSAVNPMLFPKHAHPYGRGLDRWSELLWSWLLAQPFDDNPILDPTGDDCDVGQHGPVWFLAAVPGSSLGTTVTRTCTIPRHRAILVQLSSLINDYPCPAPTFHPAPGQSLFDFLIGPVTPIFDNAMDFSVSFDGVDLVDPMQYRYTSDDLFFFRGDASMQPFDACITGHHQPAVSDGFYLPFKPMSPGHHKIVIHAFDMMGVAVTLIWNLTIR